MIYRAGDAIQGGKIRIKAVLGSKDLITIYSVEHTILGKEYVMRQHHAGTDTETGRKFLEEAVAICRTPALPGQAQMVDVFSHEDEAFCLLSYPDDATILDVMAAEGVVPGAPKPVPAPPAPPTPEPVPVPPTPAPVPVPPVPPTTVVPPTPPTPEPAPAPTPIEDVNSTVIVPPTPIPAPTPAPAPAPVADVNPTVIMAPPSVPVPEPDVDVNSTVIMPPQVAPASEPAPTSAPALAPEKPAKPKKEKKVKKEKAPNKKGSSKMLIIVISAVLGAAALGVGGYFLWDSLSKKSSSEASSSSASTEESTATDNDFADLTDQQLKDAIGKEVPFDGVEEPDNVLPTEPAPAKEMEELNEETFGAASGEALELQAMQLSLEMGLAVMNVTSDDEIMEIVMSRFFDRMNRLVSQARASGVDISQYENLQNLAILVDSM